MEKNEGDAFVKVVSQNVSFQRVLKLPPIMEKRYPKAIAGQTNFSVQTVRRRVKLLAREISIGNMRLCKIMKCQTKGLEMTHWWKWWPEEVFLSHHNSSMFIERHGHSEWTLWDSKIRSTDLILESKDQLYILTNLQVIKPNRIVWKIPQKSYLALNMKRVLEWNRNIILEGVPELERPEFDRLKILEISKMTAIELPPSASALP